MIVYGKVELIGMAKEGEPLLRPLGTFAIPAGFPSPADECIEELDIGAYLIRQPDSTYLMRVSGDSMKDAGIFNGDILVVDKSLEAESGDIVIAVINGELTVKRLYKDRKTVELRPENPRYRKIVLQGEDELVIWGVVTGAAKKFK